MEIQKLTAVSLGKKIKEKEISVREALDAVFAQIDQTEDRYHAYVTLALTSRLMLFRKK